MGWSAPPSSDATTGKETEPPDRGTFLIKVGGRRDIPIRAKPTETETATSNTNKRWHAQSRASRRLRLVESQETAS